MSCSCLTTCLLPQKHHNLNSPQHTVLLAGRPNLQISSLDTSLLKSRPSGLTINLPNFQGGLKVLHRSNIKVNAEFDFDQDDVSTSSGRFGQQRFPTVWVGTVAGLRRGYSAVVLTHDETNDAVRGSVRFWDRRAGTFRTFRVSAPAAASAFLQCCYLAFRLMHGGRLAWNGSSAGAGSKAGSHQ
jgi:hypothetical protein